MGALARHESRIAENELVEIAPRRYIPTKLGVYIIIPFVPTPSVVNSAISARQTCFCLAVLNQGF